MKTGAMSVLQEVQEIGDGGLAGPVEIDGHRDAHRCTS